MKKFLFFCLIFFLIIFTSLVKNSTKDLDSEIYSVRENLILLENRLKDTKLEFNYLSSSEKILDYQKSYFEDSLEKKSLNEIKSIEILKNSVIIKNLKMNNENEQYLSKFILEEQNNEFKFGKNRSKIYINFNRVASIFFIFFLIALIYSIHLLHLGNRKNSSKSAEQIKILNKLHRADILDRNGSYLAKTVSSIDVGINPIEAIDKKNFY